MRLAAGPGPCCSMQRPPWNAHRLPRSCWPPNWVGTTNGNENRSTRAGNWQPTTCRTCQHHKSSTFNKSATMTPFFGEMIGTGLLVFLGQTVVSNVVLAKTKGHNSGWIVISFGWAMAVFVGGFCLASARHD